VRVEIAASQLDGVEKERRGFLIIKSFIEKYH
jgi:hypothetical protein